MFRNSSEFDDEILYWDTQRSNSSEIRDIIGQLRREQDVGIIDKQHDVDTLVEIMSISENLPYNIDVTDLRAIRKYSDDLERELNTVKSSQEREELLTELGRVHRLNQIHSETISELAKTDPETILIALQTGYILLDSANILSGMNISDKAQSGKDVVSRVGEYISSRGGEVKPVDEVDEDTRQEIDDTIQTVVDDWQ